MTYVKLSSEYLTCKAPADAEKHLSDVLSQIGAIESTANDDELKKRVGWKSR
jgi:hypothetical protein